MKRFPWLALIVIVGILLALREAVRAPMWMDEIYTLRTASHGVAHAFHLAGSDVHPPLHNMLVALWYEIGGGSDLWLRLPSIAFGALAIVGTFLLARDMFGRGAGLLAAAMLAIHPQHVHFSQEVRSYPMLWMLFVWAWWFAWRWIKDGRPWAAVGYVAAATLALYTHYFTGLVLMFTGAAGLIALRATPRRMIAWAGLHVAIAVLFLPQLPVFLRQNARLEHQHWIKPPHPRDLIDLARHLGYGAVYLIPVFAVLALTPLLRRQLRRPAVLLWIVSAGPIAVSYVATLAGAHLFSIRYMYFTLPVFCALVAAGVVSLRPPWARWAVAAFVLIMGARSMALAGPFPEAATYARVRAALEPRIEPGDVLFCGDTHSLMFFLRYVPELRVRLLWMKRPVPYFEGRLVIPDSLVVGPEVFARRDSLGARWWGVRYRHGGTSSDPQAALFTAASGSRGHRDGLAEWWGPVAATASEQRDHDPGVDAHTGRP